MMGVCVRLCVCVWLTCYQNSNTVKHTHVHMYVCTLKEIKCNRFGIDGNSLKDTQAGRQASRRAE